MQVTMVSIETLPQISQDPNLINIFAYLDISIACYFTLEYLGRLYLARKRYVTVMYTHAYMDGNHTHACVWI